MPIGNIPPQLMAVHDREQRRAALEAAIAGPEVHHSDDSEAEDDDEDEDEDTDSSPPRAYARGAGGRAFPSEDGKITY